MPKLIHEQQGLRIVENDHNGFTVVSLHYSADPRKRSELWRKEAAQGISKAKFEQEYEISYDAMLGEKVFPEIKSRRNEIVFSEGPFIDNVWPSHLVFWGGFDYGSRNPSAFVVYTIYDGVIYAVWELYEPCKNIIEFVAKMKACPYWDKIKYIACDPDIRNLKHRDMKTGLPMSVEQEFNRLGVYRLLMGNNDEQAWLASMQRHWRGETVGFKISSMCPKLIEEFELATYVSMSNKQLETADYREQLVDKRNHALDACKYFMNTNPSVAKVRPQSLLQSSTYCPWLHAPKGGVGRGVREVRGYY